MIEESHGMNPHDLWAQKEYKLYYTIVKASSKFPKRQILKTAWESEKLNIKEYK